MADLWEITFDGETLMSASEGVYDFKPGLFKRDVFFKKLPLGCGEIPFDSGYSGATHELSLFYLTTTTNKNLVWEYYARVQDLFDGREGTLEIPDFPDFKYCVITDANCEDQTRIALPTPLNDSSTGFTQGYNIIINISFRQVRKAA